MGSVLAVGFERQLQVIMALVTREFRFRNSKHPFKQVFDLLEAIVFIVGHWIIFTYLHRALVIGDSLLVFITTGIFPVLIFRAISQKTAGSIESHHNTFRNLAIVSALDYSIARSFVEFITFTGAFLPLFAIIFLLGMSRDAIPYNPIALLEFVPLLYAFAFGCGLVNSYLISIFPVWKFFWAGFSRVQIFFSAVFFIPEYMPPQIRDIVAYNPIMHYVALFRTAFYQTYPTHLMSMSYMVVWSVGTLMTGLVVERAARLHRGH